MIKSKQDKKRIFRELASLMTEQRNINTMDIDTKSTKEIIKLINEDDKKVAHAAEKTLKKADGSVKVAIVMIKTNLGHNQAIDLSKKADRFVRKAIELEKPTVFMQKDKNKEKRE